MHKFATFQKGIKCLKSTAWRFFVFASYLAEQGGLELCCGVAGVKKLDRKSVV